MPRMVLVVLACCLATPVLAQDSAKTDPKIIKVTLENEQVRVLDAHYEPHDKTAMHDHLVPRVVVFLTDQYAKITLADGRTVEARRKAGDAVLFPPEKHAVENLSDKPFEAVEIELKCASDSDGSAQVLPQNQRQFAKTMDNLESVIKSSAADQHLAVAGLGRREPLPNGSVYRVGSPALP